jgi:hypothetical protein
VCQDSVPSTFDAIQVALLFVYRGTSSTRASAALRPDQHGGPAADRLLPDQVDPEAEKDQALLNRSEGVVFGYSFYAEDSRLVGLSIRAAWGVRWRDVLQSNLLTPANRIHSYVAVPQRPDDVVHHSFRNHNLVYVAFRVDQLDTLRLN